MQTAQQDHRPKRSASQGTLQNSYAYPGRPFHKPLRSVNENSVLLPSPGSLGGMLKTTTETGDIGIFSIKPAQTTCEVDLSSGARDFHGPGPHPLRKLPCRSLESMDRHGDHGKPPSQRDTASEILSMYGSNSQSSVASTLSQSIDDTGRWSSSITTVGSRHLSQKKPDVTVQRQSSGGGPLQRPRSPYPYPTRLKRPGTRPVSPAINESGLVDYSRMVEIDRVSHRTARGSSRPFPSRGPRLRAETSNHMPLFPGHAQLPFRHNDARVASARTLSAASHRSWRSISPRCVFNSPPLRASSLTSVINTYSRMPPTLMPSHSGPQAHLPQYYDYTEDFENSRFCSTTPVQPIAPVPTRIHSVQRAMVLREGSEEQLASGIGEESDFKADDTDSKYGGHETGPLQACSTIASQAQRTTMSTRHTSFARCTSTHVPSNPSQNKRVRCNDIDFLPSQVSRVSTDDVDSSLDITSGDTVVGIHHQDQHWITSFEPQAMSSEGQVQLQGFPNPAICIEQALGTDTVSRGGREDGDKYEANGASGILPLAGTRNTPVTRLSPSAPMHDNTSAAARVEGRICKANHAESPMTGQPVTVHSDTTDALLKEDLEPVLETPGPKPKLSSIGVQTGDTVEHASIQSLNISPKSDQAAKPASRAASDTRCGYRRHKRHNTALDICRDQVPDGTKAISPRLASTSSGPPLIAPQPTSPAMQFRIKNSIPNLMKALPTLPGSCETRSGRKELPSEDEDRYSEVLQPLDQRHLTNPTPLRSESIATATGKRAPEKNPGAQKKLRRIRLRSKEAGSGSPHAARTTPQDETLPHTQQHQTPSPNGGLKTHEMLPLEFNHEREPLEANNCTFLPPETVRWHPGACGSPVVAALATEPPQDLFTSANRLTTMFQKTIGGGRDVQGDSNVVNEAHSAIKHHSLTDELRDGKAELARRDEEELSLRQPSVLTDWSTVVYSRKLKRRISGIGRLVGRTGQGRWQDLSAGRRGSGEKKGVHTEKETLTRGNGSKNKDLTVGEKVSPEMSHRQQFRRRIRSKIFKWARETKNAIKGRGRTHRAAGVDRDETV